MLRDRIVVRTANVFEDLLAPWISLELTLLLFATFIFLHRYFGPDHVISDFFALDVLVPVVTYLFGGVLLEALAYARRHFQALAATHP